MEGSATGHASLKERALEELKEFWITALYLFVFLGSFTLYRRMVLAEFGITYLNYGVALIEALIIAKVVLIGRALGLDKLADRGGPLILVVIFKSVVFSILVFLFGILEKIAEGLYHKKDWDSILQELLSVSEHELLARMIMLFVSFIPFFAFWEIGNILGRRKLIEMFFSRSRPSLPQA
jgi:hypothetical protein